ncbi:MAG: sensor histidine kinase [Sarcina sp.]
MKDKKLIIYKYIFLFAFFISTTKNEANFIISFIVSLIFVICANLRMFHIKEEEKNFVFLCVEIVIAVLVMSVLNLRFGLYFLFIASDIFYVKNKKKRKVLIIFCALASVKEILVYRNLDVLVMFLLFGGSLFILSYMSTLYKAKEESQNLYDRLRISEEKLQVANRELENYANSIEEIAILKERNRISREVHDGIGHVLSTTMIQLSAMERIGKMEENTLGEMAGNLREFVSEGFSDVKTAIRELKPLEYESYEGLIRISELCKKVEGLSDLDVRLTITGDRWNLKDIQEMNLYRIIQESLSNCIKHSKATKVLVIISFDDESLMLVIKDDGCGVKEIKESGVGIKSVKERTKELFGTVEYISNESDGFTIKIIIPKEGGLKYGED